MKDRVKKYIKEIALFFLVMTIFANAISLYRSSDLNKESLQLENITLINSVPYTLKKNRPTLIHFWATWCPICKAEASNIQTISEHFEVLTIAINSGKDSELKEYLKSRSLNFNVLNDKSGSISQKYGVSVFPTTIIYDKNGDVIFSDVGYTSTFGLWLRMWWAGI